VSLLSSNRSTVVCSARAVFALMLLIACLSTSVPLIVSASAPGSMCELACCAGRAPHAAGSCRNGSCHAVLPNRSRASHRVGRISPRPEHLCGVPRRIETKSSARIRPAQTLSQTASDHKHLSGVSLTRPCQPECGGCSASFTNSNQRNSATLGHDHPPRPRTNARLAGFTYSSSRVLAGLCRQCAPRGPPLSFS
jgi:hypothetical protein